MTIQFYSTRAPQGEQIDLPSALLRGLAPDGGLYWPTEIPQVESASATDFVGVAQAIAQAWFGDTIDAATLAPLIADAYPFAPTLTKLSDDLTVCELFHGPTLSFKDFAAQCLMRLLDHVLAQRGERALLLTATSGDTGSAVAAAAHGRSNIDAVVLYPKGRISRLQEQQIATWGDNVHAVRVHGTFDDCQALVKSALQQAAPAGTHLSSANSINVGRLLPQTFYYWYAAQQLQGPRNTTVVVPSGNFGNMTAGLLAARMGAPLTHFVAGTNDNDTIPRYYASGQFDPKPTKATISNAMDVSVPSNFERIRYLFGEDLGAMQAAMSCYTIDEAATKATMRGLWDEHNYLCDPHTAVAIAAWRQHQQGDTAARHALIMSTAHPAKFPDVVQEATGQVPTVPESLQERMGMELSFAELANGSDEAFAELLLRKKLLKG